jgi:glycosyltransferase involved in cell wall biosynthesis
MYKSNKSKFLIIIPAYNELKNLKKFVKKVNKLAPVYILDDCSTDNTEEWLLKNNIRFLKNKNNLGYEKNLLNGVKKLKKYCEYLITFDGDGQHKISDLKKIINFKKNYDILVCNRKIKNRFLEEIISFISNFFFGLKDPLSGFKVYKTKILKKNNFIEIGDFFLLDFLLKFVKSDLKIINIGIKTKKRIGSPKVGGLISLFLKEFKILFKLISKIIQLKI